jgi:hypothetical protein
VAKKKKLPLRLLPLRLLLPLPLLPLRLLTLPLRLLLPLLLSRPRSNSSRETKSHLRGWLFFA